MTRPDAVVGEAALGGAPHERLELALYSGAPHEVLRAFGDEVGRAEELPETDRPLMRGLFFDWPGDGRVWDWPLQFLLGDDLLVHPVTAGGVSEWETYLPAGRWVDVWTGEELEGGQVVTREVPVTVVPVYCRATRWPDLRKIFHP